MKNDLKGQKRVSSFYLKQQFIGLLAGEFANCGFNIVLGFESSFKRRICKLEIVDGKQARICVNLGHLKSSVCIDGASLLFRVRYCALFIAEYIKQIERAKNSMPKSYFEGLAFLNAIEVCKSGRTVGIYSPLSHWNKKHGLSYCLRPLEISSAINALNRIRLLDRTELNEQEGLIVGTLCDSLLLYSCLPEVSYIRSQAPAYALVDSLRRLAALITRERDLTDEFPILSLAPFDKIKQLTVSGLFEHCIRSDNEFLTGVSVRLIAYLQPSLNITASGDAYQRTIDAIKRYIDYSLYYYRELPKSGGRILKDNLYAIKTAVRSINGCLSRNGIDVISGNIHSIM